MSEIQALRREAKKHGLSVIDCGNGHYQIKGGLVMVNYYPESKNRTAYIAKTRKGFSHVSAGQAIRMCLNQPKEIKRKPRRASSKTNRSRRLRLLAKNPHCHWCKCALTEETATLEHIVPLKRGGLDNMNNLTIACKECNNKRGHNMEATNVSLALPE